MNKKVVVLGDTHGLDYWKLIVEEENPDLTIFIGDYLDSFDIPAVEQLHNLKEIIQFKKDNLDKVILLIGNHDFHYLKHATNMGEYYSGFQSSQMFNYQILLEENIHLFQMCFNFDNYLFTHAGISEEWLNRVQISSTDINVVCDEINDLFKYKPLHFNFTGTNPYGDSVESSPIWIRPKSLMKDNKNTFLHKNSIQIVGHTQQNCIDIKGKSTGGKYYFIDTLRTSGEYLVIRNNELIVGTQRDKYILSKLK